MIRTILRRLTPDLSPTSLLRAGFHQLYQLGYRVAPLIDLFPDELVCVGCCTSVATSSTHKGLAIIRRVACYLALGMFGEKDVKR